MIQPADYWEREQIKTIATVAACDEKIKLLGEYYGRSENTAEADTWHHRIEFLKKLREQLAAGPRKVLSIRQPWAWLIMNAGKDVENRSRISHYRGPLDLHASATMTVADYEACVRFCMGIADRICFDAGLGFPSFAELKAQCGGIVGEVVMTDCVTKSDSPWFVGDYGYLFKDAKPKPFRKCKGQLNFFTVPPILGLAMVSNDTDLVIQQSGGMSPSPMSAGFNES